jgi:mono/diheme cytochrome c family protein
MFRNPIVASMALLGVAAVSAQAGDLERGRALHDTHCLMCHDPGIYSRPDRIANSYLEIRQQVQRWQDNTRLRWTQYDVESVTDWLADKHYKLPY